MLHPVRPFPLVAEVGIRVLVPAVACGGGGGDSDRGETQRAEYKGIAESAERKAGMSSERA